MISVLFVRRVCVALQCTRLQHRLTEFCDRIRNLDLDLGEQPPQIVQHAIQIQLSGADQHVLTTLLNLGRSQGVGFVDGSKARKHLGEFRWRNGFNGHLEHRLCCVFQRAEDV